MSRYIVDLDSRAALQETRAGGKGANIARLRRQGFRVPPGFVIAPAAFQNFLADFEIETLTQRRDWGERDLERIREMLMVCRIPDRLTRPINRAYRRLGGCVAVRSSMVGEDADLASFAGQLDTVLNVAGTGEILQAVRGAKLTRRASFWRTLP
jgi:phosphoenolpyruvate synthase/pyruvate phosphate dikinase